MAATSETITLARDTAVRSIGGGRFSATVSSHWSTPRGPNGGYVAALFVRALAVAVDDAARAPRSLTLHYLRPPAPGPCEIAVTVERTGRSLTSLSARLVQGGETMVVALAAFATAFPAAIDYARAAPDVGPPPELRLAPPDAGFPSVAYRCATAPVFGPGIFRGGDEALTGGWLRLAEPEVPDAAAVAFFTDAWMPAPYARLTAPAPAPTIDLTIHFRTALPHPEMDADTPVLVRFASTTSADGFFEEDGAIWAPDGTLLAQSRQLALLVPPR